MDHNLSRRSVLSSILLAPALANLPLMANEQTEKFHIVLMGDSVFDNKVYVGSKTSVKEHLQKKLKDIAEGHQVTLLAVDGHKIADMKSQLEKLKNLKSEVPPSHIILSIGGNNALEKFSILNMLVKDSAVVFEILSQIQEQFEIKYESLMKEIKLVTPQAKLMISTIYTSNFPQPQINRHAGIGLLVYNDVIRQAAVKHQLPLLDLNRLFQDQPTYYANPIEPSHEGGDAITERILDFVFSRKKAGQIEIY